MNQNKQNFIHHSKYNSTYIKELNRKVLFKNRIYLIDLTLKDPKKIGAGHISRSYDEGNDSYNMIIDMSIILNNKDLKIRFIDMIYRQLTSRGIASLILRKLITSSNLTWQELRDYTNKICERFNSDTISKPILTCFKINNNLLKNLLNLIPFEFEPLAILDIAGSDNTKSLLSSHFTKVKIDIFDINKTTNTNLYDLVICNNYLHHINDKKGIADNITKLIKSGGYLFVRDSDVESEDDQLLLDILHDFYDYVTINSGVYKHQRLNYLTKDSLTELFPKLEFQSESHVKYDITNPIKTFNMLFKKPK